MKIAVISDTHGMSGRLRDLCDVFNECNAVFFLGDGERDLIALKELIDTPVIAVAGNNDYGSMLPKEYIADICGTKFFLTHGHSYGVQGNLFPLLSKAKECGCAFALFGHTHVPCVEKCDGITLMNPGSLTYPRTGKPSYGMIESDKNGLFGKIVFI